MPSILIIDRNSTIKSHNIKAFAEDELYKKAGFKNKNGFAKHTEWSFTINNKIYIIELYGKTTGRAGQENKYEFPPPADKTLFFGSCVLVCKENDTVGDISPKEWEKVYEYLHGGFEDIDGDSSEDEEDDEEDANVPRTKQGYVKDGFIVDDDADDEEYTESSTDEEFATRRTKKPAQSKNLKPIKNPSSSSKSKSKQPTDTANAPTQTATAPHEQTSETISYVQNAPEEATYLSCTDELTEEPYV
jgi:hypothetical protein